MWRNRYSYASGQASTAEPVVQVFDSLADHMGAADRAYQSGRQSSGLADSLSYGPSFIGRSFADWNDVVQKVKEYWPEGLDLVQEMLFELRNSTGQVRPKSRLRRGRWSADNGDEIDIDRLRAGQDCWRQAVREEHDAPQHLCLVFSMGGVGSISAEELLWRGALAIVLADLLESAGYRVELWGCNLAKNAFCGGRAGLQAIRMKESSAPVDIASLVNGVAGWYFRTVCFQADVCAGVPLGNARETVRIHADMPQVRDLAVAGARIVCIDGVWNREAALAKVQEVMASLS